MKQTKLAVIGAAGYTGGELLRLLSQHPKVHSIQAISESQAGRLWSDVHSDLWQNARFQAELQPCDLVFLCGEHGRSASLLARHAVFEKAERVIDLSQDFRDGTDGFVYGLSEVNQESIARAARIANPGCFATAIQMALWPLAASGHMREAVHVTAMTGSTGAGQKLARTVHFSERQQNASVYKAFEHQHELEIKRSLKQWTDHDPALYFVPLRGPFTRGILVSLYSETGLTGGEALKLYSDFYRSSPFVKVTGEEIHLKSVINTNRTLLSVRAHGGLSHVVCCLDNLLKGAAGQAVQNMNLMMGWPETSGLDLKAVAY